jgi:hypothetical protein
MEKDISIIFYTCNKINPAFFENTKKALLDAAGDIPIISISHKPMELGTNICVGDIGQSDFNIYRQVLIGAKAATTKYVAMAEDDTLYHKSHFAYRPSDDAFAYNMNKWSLFTWSIPPIFSNRGRRTLNAMICNRELLIEALEERFAKYPVESEFANKFFAEPSRYESFLKVKIQKSETFSSEIPIIMFSHPKALNYIKQGVRKKLGIDQSYSLPFWGDAKAVAELYK